ncbi:hypothetical protein IQ07DRAFT_465690, partial [Pyrenochaeta sp. DS3sAY3a]
FDQVFGPLLPDDDARLAIEGVDPPEQSELLAGEADVTRLFSKQLSGVVMSAYTGDYLLTEVHQAMPMRDQGQQTTSCPGRVDCSFYKTEPDGSVFDVAIGDFKAPGAIDKTWWEAGEMATKAKSLGRELRGYAYYYGCPQVFCYDGLTLLIIRFQAHDRKAIKQCAADLFVVPNIKAEGGIYPRYALYRLLGDGVHRVKAKSA